MGLFDDWLSGTDDEPEDRSIDPARIIPATGPWGIPDADFWDMAEVEEGEAEAEDSDEEE